MTAHLGPAANAFVDGQLDHRQRDEVSAHLVHCRPCRDDIEGLRALKGSLRIGWPDLPADLSLRLLAAEPQEEPVPEQRRHPRSPSRARRTALGGALVVLGVGATLGLAGPPPSGPGPRIDPASTRFVIDHAETAGEVPSVEPALVAVLFAGAQR